MLGRGLGGGFRGIKEKGRGEEGGRIGRMGNKEGKKDKVLRIEVEWWECGKRREEDEG